VVDLAVLGLWLDSMTLRVFSNLRDSVIDCARPFHQPTAWQQWKSLPTWQEGDAGLTQVLLEGQGGCRGCLVSQGWMGICALKGIWTKTLFGAKSGIE